MSSTFPSVYVSQQSRRTFNPIRNVVDRLDITGNPDLAIIPLSIGDPSIFGNLSPHDVVTDSFRSVLNNGKHHGYPPSNGYLESRQAVADRYSNQHQKLTSQDVVLCSGGSSAIDMCLTSLLDPGDPVLIPNPGFSLYTTLSVSYQFECCYYNLLPDRFWQIDLDHVEQLIKKHGRIRVMIINNPSNPCGNVFSKDHCLDILRLAQRYNICIVSDEIYAELVFQPDTQFHALGNISEHVPVLTIGGLAKEFLVPGWRLGWILVHDRHEQLRDVRKALVSMSQMILGPNSMVQAALPAIFSRTPSSYFQSLNATLRSHAEICVEKLKSIKGLQCIPPSGALYLMVKIDFEYFDEFQDDVDFSQKLLREKSVFVLPGTAFRAFGFFRVVFCAPSKKLIEAFDRIAEFCHNHSRCHI